MCRRFLYFAIPQRQGGRSGAHRVNKAERTIT
nr:MAG TPA: hypothetical protein [Caudoviricetes sp.]DAI42749.1 MAG TPA: hypothetical protein [Caudoviricetes sp.]DAU23184.1 MAG TPA: hypothetical protein [Caudoviricetes sp.]